ncbi:hypothetical protein KKG29_00125 [Patescibacteria group bacterium]|nr:hypothetical protein [Patescibacteria group bacterium]MBU3999576.1 hypothetical protein [Patescibacteria group bacterium]MBU4056949.1 hypothetical protein [Patescibacteria group bacterium]MBU4368813.1 hypothetical protein [Patescibacteria group bacterium]
MEKFYPNLDIKSLASCPLCNNHYSSREIKILSKKDESVILYFNCSRCKNAVISVISAGVFGITAVSMVTDLSAAEAEKAKNEKAVSADDVLMIYKFFSEKGKSIVERQKSK